MEEKINSSILTGRPFGGTAILVSNRLAKHTNYIITNSSRVTAVQLTNNKQQNIVISCIYMPWNDGSVDQLVEYISVLGCLQSLLDRHIGSLFICGGNFNVEKYSFNQFNEALQLFCSTNNLCWSEPVENSVQYTFHNDVNDHFSLINHFICSAQLLKDIICTHILLNGANTSDHLAISITLAALEYYSSVSANQETGLKLQWDKADLDVYRNILTQMLSTVTLPTDALLC